MRNPFYTEYVRHCLRFYTRNPNITQFNSLVDKENWYACQRAASGYPGDVQEIILQVYTLRDTMADNVYEVAKANCIDVNIFWDIVKELERNVAKNRGLI